MTGHGSRFGVALALAFAGVLTFAIGACGGSSSETPPPLQPDPQGYHYGSPASAERDTSDAGVEPAATDTDEDDGKPHPPVRSTWGVASPRH